MQEKEINIKVHSHTEEEAPEIEILKDDEPKEEQLPPAPEKKKSSKIPDPVPLKKSKLFYAMNIIVLVAVLGIGSLIMLFAPRPTVSEQEKRELAKFPEFSAKGYFDGSFMTGLSAFFADTVPFRDKLIDLGSYIKEGYGVRFDNVTFHGNVSALPETTEPPAPPVVIPSETDSTAPAVTTVQTDIVSGAETTATAPAETTHPAESAQTLSPEEENQQLEVSNNGIVIVGDRGLMLFGGNKAEGRHYANVVNSFKQALGDDVNVYAMVVPTAVEFYLPKKYKQYSTGEKEYIDDIYAHLEGATGIDAYSKLAAHINENIYLKTDHHWAQLGSYYAYTAFAEALGEEPTPIADYEEKVKPGFVGSLYGYTNDITLKNNPEDFHYFLQPDNYTTYYYKWDTLAPIGAGPLYYESASGGNMYSMFIGADAIHTKIVSENKNGRKLAVFKDSFGNAFTTHLMRHFEEVYVIDIRYFGRCAVDYLKEVGITDVIFVNNIFAANTYSLVSKVETLLTGPVGITAPPVTEAPPPETTAAPPAEETAPVTAAPAVTETPPPTDTAPTEAPTDTAAETAAPEAEENG